MTYASLMKKVDDGNWVVDAWDDAMEEEGGTLYALVTIYKRDKTERKMVEVTRKPKP